MNWSHVAVDDKSSLCVWCWQNKPRQRVKQKPLSRETKHKTRSQWDCEMYDFIKNSIKWNDKDQMEGIIMQFVQNDNCIQCKSRTVFSAAHPECLKCFINHGSFKAIHMHLSMKLWGLWVRIGFWGVYLRILGVGTLKLIEE